MKDARMRVKNGGSRIENVEWREICLKCNLLFVSEGGLQNLRTLGQSPLVDFTPNYKIVGGEGRYRKYFQDCILIHLVSEDCM